MSKNRKNRFKEATMSEENQIAQEPTQEVEEFVQEVEQEVVQETPAPTPEPLPVKPTSLEVPKVVQDELHNASFGFKAETLALIFGKFEGTRQLTDIEVRLCKAIEGPSKSLQIVAKGLAAYRRDNGSNVAATKETASEQNGKMWSVLSVAMNDKETFRESFELIVAVYRENRNKAFSLPSLLRFIGAPGTQVVGSHANTYTNMVAVLTRVAEINRKSDVTRSIDLTLAFKDTVFPEVQVKKFIGWLTQP